MKNYFFYYFLIFMHINLYCAPTIICDLFSQPIASQGFNLMMENLAKGQKKSRLGATLSLGRYALSSFLNKRNPADLKNQLMDLLDKMPVEKQSAPLFYQGKQLPSILGYHIKNNDPNDNTLKLVFEFIDQSNAKNKDMLKAAAQIIFTPEQTARSIKPNQKVINLLSEIKNLYPNTKFILTANFKTFKPLITKKSFEKFFDLFKRQDSNSYNMICSGDINELKSSPTFFERLIEKYGCNKERTILIDSELEHTAASQKAGIKNTIYWNKNLSTKRILQLVKEKII